MDNMYHVKRYYYNITTNCNASNSTNSGDNSKILLF